jgi:ABC-2 type transport system ATP-binding protein
VDFEVTKGKIHGLIGANGSGKSTTLKILCGLIEPTSGVARIKSLNVKKFPEIIRKNLGYIPENPSLYPSLTVKETLEFIGAINSVPNKGLEPQMSKYMKEFDIQHLSEKHIVTLSRGELQKILICSLLMKEPEIFLLDEPFYALDPKSARIFREILKEKSKEGTTILFATHLLDVAERICDSLTIIDEGKTIITGELKEIIKINNQNLSLEEAFIKYTNR